MDDNRCMNTTPITRHPEDDFLHPTSHAHIAERRADLAAFGTADLRGTVRTFSPTGADAAADAATVAAARWNVPTMTRATVHAPRAMHAATVRVDLTHLSFVQGLTVALGRYVSPRVSA